MSCGIIWDTCRYCGIFVFRSYLSKQTKFIIIRNSRTANESDEPVNVILNKKEKNVPK